MTGGGAKLVDAAPILSAEMRAARRELVGAADARVLQVLRYVDELPDRGAADALVAPLRARFRQLRPPRKVNFARVLLTPMDALLVNPGVWKPGSPNLPRSIATPFAALIRRTAPEIAAVVDRILQDKSKPDRDLIHQAGEALWPAAAKLLRDAAAPPEWGATLLSSAMFRSLATAVSTCLSAACTIETLSDPATPAAETEDALTKLFGMARQDGPLAWAMILTLALQRFPQTAAVRTACLPNPDPAMRAAAADALQAGWTWIEGAEAALDTSDAAQAADEIGRRALLLEMLGRDAEQNGRASALRATLRVASIARLEAGLRDRVLAPLQLMTGGNPQGDLVMTTIEADARALRRFDTEARRLGGAAKHEASLHTTAAAVQARHDLAPMDRLRLIELLLGSRAAQLALKAAPHDLSRTARL